MYRAILIFSSVLILCPIVEVSAQSYVTAMGLRMGSDFGITLQQRLIGHLSGEAIVSSSAVTSETTATFLTEIHNPLISKRFNFYIGAGPHYRWLPENDGQRDDLYGVTAIAGAEMTLGRINISWDYKPTYHLNAEAFPFENQTAVSLRYVFIRKLGKDKKIELFSPSKKKKKQKAKMKAKRKRQKSKEKERSKNHREQNRHGVKEPFLDRLFDKKNK